MERGNIVLKPVQRFPKGCRELEFYNKVFEKDQRDPIYVEIKRWIPKFFGVEIIQISNRNPQYMKLEDVTKHFDKPCITDLKIGKQTYNPLADLDKITKERSKYPRLSEVGFQLLGMRIYDPSSNNYTQYDRIFGRSLEPEELCDKGLRLFLTQNGEIRRDALKEIILQVKHIKDFFVRQRKLSFYSSSLLVVYEGNSLSEGKVSNVASVKMIDFAHVFPTQNSDENYIFGLETLLKMFSSLQSSTIDRRKISL